VRLVLVLALAAAVAVPALLTPRTGRAATTCGVERWSVKTLSDGAAAGVNLHPRASSVRSLRALPAPHVGRDTPRMSGPEHTSYRLRARLIEMKLEDDSDIHVVIADPSNPRRTMIVELPASACTSSAASTARRRMSAARRGLIRACGAASASSFRRLHGVATLTGVGFFDVRHGQTGVAPNGIELHPVLSFTASGC
jgi:hypothetical protein